MPAPKPADLPLPFPFALESLAAPGVKPLRAGKYLMPARACPDCGACEEWRSGINGAGLPYPVILHSATCTRG